jgi:hypothetical protein
MPWDIGLPSHGGESGAAEAAAAPTRNRRTTRRNATDHRRIEDSFTRIGPDTGGG